jgi:8-oxo-dGTP diphosphatase
MNSELYDKKYPIPLPIINELKAKLMGSNDLSGEGVKRAKFLVNNGYATYQMLKRIKNFFDNFDISADSKQEYELSGGDNMRSFIEHTLEADRKGVKTSKDATRPIKPNMQLGLKPTKLGEAEEKEGEEKILKKNALGIIFNPENRVLLLKRSSFPDQWMPNKWALVGGGVEDGEEPIEGCIREIKEETGLVIKDLIEKAVMQRNPDSVEHIFIGKYEGDPFNVKLDEENQGYGWFGKNEIEFLDTVPNLMDYINIAIKDYE